MIMVEVRACVCIFSRRPDRRASGTRRRTSPRTIGQAVGLSCRAADAPPEALAACGIHADPWTGIIRAPHEATVRRVLTTIDGDALDTAIGAWNDLVHTIQQGTGQATSYTLDVDNHRIRSWTANGGMTTVINHYNDGGDSPSWTDEGNGTSVRNVSGLAALDAVASSSGAVEWQISNLNGDIVATTTAGVGFDTTSVADEFGNMESSNNVGTDAYGWLGTDQRAANNPGGLVLMGVRLYNPTTGRFLQVDPVQGGNANPYDYVYQNPVNNVDLNGMWCWTWKCAIKGTVRWALKVLFAAMASAIIGFCGAITDEICNMVAYYILSAFLGAAGTAVSRSHGEAE